MKVEINSYYNFNLIAENFQDKLWLQQAIGGINDEDLETFGEHLSIDYGDDCINKDGSPAIGLSVKEAMSSNKVDGADSPIERIEFTFSTF